MTVKFTRRGNRAATLVAASVIVLCGLQGCASAPRKVRAKPKSSLPSAPLVVKTEKPSAPTPAAKPKVASEPRDPIPLEAKMIGTNLACGEFGKAPGVLNKDYTYPGESQFEYCKKKGLLVVRLPFKWERVQRSPMAALDATELGRLDRVVALARERGIKLLLDVHDYARYNGAVIGTAETPNAVFGDLWRKLASHYKDESAIFAYGIMNEPFDTKGLWKAAAQAAVDAIRSVDMDTTILVCGDSWGGAHSWKSQNNDLILNDPAKNLVYEAHQYFDRDSSGTYKLSYDESGAYPTIGVDRLKPFIEWLREHDARGFIGEFGVPDNDPRWLVVLDHFVAALKENDIGGTYWASGPWWGNYPLSLEPRDGEDRPQMAVLAQYAGSRFEPSDKPWAKEAARLDATREERNAERVARKKAAAAAGVVYDFGARKESYHYANEGSLYSSEEAVDGGRSVRKVTYTHKGSPAWLGVGLYFGGLDCEGYSAFSLSLRSAKPCWLEVKAYHADNDRYNASFQVGTDWQELRIPFEKLKQNDKAYDENGGGRLHKFELQPGTDAQGNSIFFGELKLVTGKAE